MSRSVVSITLDVLADLPDPCRSCVFWELDPVSGERAAESGDASLEKEAWVSATLLEWGSCGSLLYVDDVPVGHALYAPPAYVPRGTAFPTAPASADAVLLTSLRLVDSARGQGYGRLLVQSMARDLVRRGVRAVEAYGDARAGDPSTGTCIVPADFLLAVGFKTVRPHHRHPRLRLDLRTALSWREDMEAAIERIIGSVKPVAVGARRDAQP